MPRVLKDITINEVSSVDRGAGRGVKVMLMKRDAADPAKAQQIDLIPDTSKRDGNGDISMTKEELDKLVADSVTAGIAKALEAPAAALAKQADEIVLLKMTDAHKAYMAGCSADTQKTFKAMSSDERDAFMQKNPIKKAADPVDQSELAKRDTQIAELLKSQKDMATELAATRLEKAQADFKKRAVEAGLTEADGETMRKAFGGDAEAQTLLNKRYAEVTAALKKQIDTGKLFGEFGTAKGAQGDAYTALMTKAEELQKADGKITTEQAFAKVYENPANRELVSQHKAEEARKRLTVVAA